MIAVVEGTHDECKAAGPPRDGAVRKACFDDVQSGYQRLAVTQRLLNEANQALTLAESRYSLGLGSILELTQAQLNQTEANIQQATARYDYESLIATLNYELGALR